MRGTKGRRLRDSGADSSAEVLSSRSLSDSSDSSSDSSDSSCDSRGGLARADAIDLGRYVPAGAAGLAYLDPPFSVGARFGARTRPREHRAAGPVAYDDRWPSMKAYLGWLEPRLRAVRTALSPRGTMWLHLDHRAVHEAKLLCDAVFPAGAFAGEVIWVPGNGAKGRSGLGMSHQTILVYAAGKDYVWRARDPAVRAPFAATSLSMHFTKKTDEGRSFRERTIRGRTYRYYADEGRAIGSVWSDCPAMAANTPLRRETTGYPTQKPLKLLDRIVRAASDPGALVLDPFCGSGTTLEAAGRAGRRFFGCDLGELAVSTVATRLRTAGIAFDLRPPPPDAAARAHGPPVR
jgi:site-specific DNA-methyltransferase (adenine-specific)